MADSEQRPSAKATSASITRTTTAQAAPAADLSQHLSSPNNQSEPANRAQQTVSSGTQSQGQAIGTQAAAPFPTTRERRPRQVTQLFPGMTPAIPDRTDNPAHLIVTRSQGRVTRTYQQMEAQMERAMRRASDRRRARRRQREEGEEGGAGKRARVQQVMRPRN